MTKRIFDDFDAYADDYRAIHNQNIKISGADSFYFAKMKVDILQDFEKNSSLKVLDVGCGDGTTAMFFAKLFPLWMVTGVDVSVQSIAEAQKKQLPNCTFLAYDGFSLPFENNSFDMVFIAGVLHHVSHHLHNQLLTNMQQCLKAGGRLYLFEHNPINPLTRYLVNTCVFDKNAKLLPYGYTQKIIKQASLKLLSTQFIIFFPRNKWFSKILFLEKYLQKLPVGGQYFIRALKP